MLTIALTAALAADPWEQPPLSLPPAHLLAAVAASEPVPNPDEAWSNGVRIVLEETVDVVSEDGTVDQTWRMVFVPTDRQTAEGMGTLQVAWDPHLTDRPTILARVVAPDGTVAELDPATISEGSASDDPKLLTDTRRLLAPLPRMAAGVVVEQVVRKRSRPVLEGTYTLADVLERTVPVETLRYVVDLPASMDFTPRVVGMQDGADPPIDLELDARKARGRVVHRLEGTAITPIPALFGRADPDLPRFLRFEGSNVDEWRTIGERWSGLAEPAVQTPPEAFLAPLRGRTGLDLVAAAATALHDRVRYTGLELGAGSYVPSPPSVVLERGFGDCKDKATLLVATLRALGQPAWFVLVRANGDPSLLADAPSLARFDHVVVAIPQVDGPMLYVDATDPFASVEVAPYPLQGRDGLLVDGAASHIVTIPLQSAESSTLIDEVRLVFDGGRRVPRAQVTTIGGALAGDVRGHQTNDPTGEQAPRLFQLTDDDNPHITATPGTIGGDPARYRVEVADDPAVSGESPRWALRLDQLVGPLPVDTCVPRVAGFDGVDHPVVFPPCRVAWEARLALGRAMEVDAASEPEPFAVTIGEASVSFAATTEGTDRVYRAEVHAGTGRMSWTDLVALDDAISRLEDTMRREIAVEDRERSWIEEGRFEDAAAAFRGRLDEDATDARAMLGLAEVLCRAGARAAADRWLTGAERAGGDAADVAYARGVCARSGALGAAWTPGFELGAARDAFGRAATLVPEQVRFSTAYVDALERGDDGRLWRTGADLDRAAGWARDRIEADDFSLSSTWARLEVATGNLDRAVAVVEDLQGSTVEALRIAADARRDPQAAARRLADVPPEDASRVLNEVTELLAVRAEVDVLVDLMSAILKRAGKPDDEWRGPIDEYLKLKQDVPDEGDPRWPIWQALDLRARGLPVPKALWSKHATPRDLWFTSEEGRIVADASAESATAVIWDVQGSDASGYRVAFADPFERKPTVAFVLAEDGGYRILAHERDLVPITRYIWHLARKQDPAARTWLEWVFKPTVELTTADDVMMFAGASWSTFDREATHEKLLALCDGSRDPEMERTMMDGLGTAALLTDDHDLARRILARLDADPVDEPGATLLRAELLLATDPTDPKLPKLIAMVEVRDAATALDLERRLAARLGDYDRVKEILNTPTFRVSNPNNVLWAGVLVGELDPKLIEALEGRVGGSSNPRDLASMHTLALAALLTRDTGLAVVILARAQALGGADPRDHWGLVVGGVQLAVGETERGREIVEPLLDDPDVDNARIAGILLERWAPPSN